MRILKMNDGTPLSRLLPLLIAAGALAACGSDQSDAPNADATTADMPEETASAAEPTDEPTNGAVDDALDDAEQELEGEAESLADDMQQDAENLADSIGQQAGDTVEEVVDAAEQVLDDVAGAVAPIVAADGDACALAISAGDNIAYSTNEMSVPASCDAVTVTITHTGNLPAAAMGHNWVLIPADAAEAIGMAGMSTGLENNFLPADDDRIVAATKIVGGGESASVTFSLADLADGTDYAYICTFPGHWSIMKGTFTVSE